MICYNDYGAVNPEGISEAPLRIPSCGHVFGDHCIKKWLRESHTCPYCRSKLAPSQPIATATVRALIEHLSSGSRRSGEDSGEDSGGGSGGGSGGDIGGGGGGGAQVSS